MTAIKASIKASSLNDLEIKNGTEACQRFMFAENFMGFSGHFKGRPILPAIVQIMTAWTVAEEMEGIPLHLEEIPKAKFVNTVKPNQEIKVTCTKKNSPKKLRFSVEINSLDELTAAFVLVGCPQN